MLKGRVGWMLCGLSLINLIATSSHAEGQQISVIALKPFNEQLNKDVPVGGNILVGAEVLRPRADNERRSMVPTLLWRGSNIEPKLGSLCVTISSRDGQYYGEGEVDANRLATLGGPARLEFQHVEPMIASHLQKLDDNELAFLARRGNCDIGNPGQSTHVHILGRGFDINSASEKNRPKNFKLRLTLNSMSYKLAIHATFQDSEKTVTIEQEPCIKLDETKRNTAFNVLCTLIVPNFATEATLIIDRQRHERVLNPLTYKLSWSPL